MIWERLQGIEVIDRMFDQVGYSAKEELGVELGILGREFLAEQRRLVPKDTGALEGWLSLAVLIDQLKVRIGLLGTSKRSKAYYGRFVQFGRKAQTVLVTRHLKRQVKGNGRYGTKRRVIYAGAGYKLRVRAKEGRNFIFIPNADAIAAQRTADFWANTFQRAGI